ncbi:MAG TPA: hypothetical protein VMD53_14395 [Rhizomicrobium sp.]|nr:hypothetical protein [Rhizomicrobium sp.]
MAMRAKNGRPERVVLRDERTDGDRRFLSAEIGAEGELIITGHDLGDGVSALTGYSEYEWTWTIAAADVPKLAAALKVRGVFGTAWRRNRRLLRALRRRFSGANAGRLGPFLKEHDIPHALWNRVGD